MSSGVRWIIACPDPPPVPLVQVQTFQLKKEMDTLDHVQRKVSRRVRKAKLCHTKRA